jgi:hypothetical protein
MHTLKNRVARLEATVSKKEPRVVVVEGYSEEDHEKAIADSIAAGTAYDHDLFVCITRLTRPGDVHPSVGKRF